MYFTKILHECQIFLSSFVCIVCANSSITVCLGFTLCKLLLISACSCYMCWSLNTNLYIFQRGEYLLAPWFSISVYRKCFLHLLLPNGCEVLVHSTITHRIDLYFMIPSHLIAFPINLLLFLQNTPVKIGEGSL